jgi:hypothetical protein
MIDHFGDDADRQNLVYVILLFFIKWLIDGASVNGIGEWERIGIQREL